MRILINGREAIVEGKSHLTYEEVVLLADESGYPSVTYRIWLDRTTQRGGEMHKGCSAVELGDGMAFSVMHTNNA